ncbi:MAG: hypothetical protein L0332_32200 [Chloroflexi bacterium]|nr:hypothetical protein [Chloroflexota bacterium]MCI0577250.1 hypothetical protein [Chloroflexota bacterium]MCI0646731.1 hypothetical protein [Chloroflexota bacterium]MCI0731365.1 hypothetical protein [Chloroflexota bacterium]
MTSALCPDCGRKIVVGPKPKKGQWVSCPHCNADLEIVSLSPLEFDWAQYDAEDEEEEFEEEYELWEEEEDDFWEDDDYADEEDWEEEESF